MMLIQSGSVAQILSGRDTGWDPQRRDDGSIPFSSIARRHRAHTVLGVITLAAAALLSPSLVVWMSPTIAGLIFSIPLSWASGQLWIGAALRRFGLLTTPEETPHASHHRARQRARGGTRANRPRRRGRAARDRRGPEFPRGARGLPAGGRAAAARRNRCRGGRRHRQAQRRPFARRGRHVAETTGTAGRSQRSGADFDARSAVGRPGGVGLGRQRPGRGPTRLTRRSDPSSAAVEQGK